MYRYMNEEPEHEINVLTRRLFAEGFTRENHPDYVEDYFWFYGGFQYKRGYQNTMVFATGCGLHVKGSHWGSGNMTYLGIDWALENDNPTINCPYRRTGCPNNNELLRKSGITGGGCATMVFCACHQIEGPYDYEKSVDKVDDIKKKHEEELFQEFSKQKNGRVCRQICMFDERNGQWRQNYDPIHTCAQSNCHYCTVLAQELNTKKGNVFYDIQIRRKVEEGVGLLHECKIVTSLIKGKRLLEKTVSLDICEAIVHICKDSIRRREEGRYSRELFFAKYHEQFFELEVLNIRAERRESRDLMQDLEDVSNGILVEHENDNKKAAKARKSDNRNKAFQAKKRKYLKMLADKKLDEIDSTSQYRIKKMIERGTLQQSEIDEVRRQWRENQPCEQQSLY